MLILHSFFTPSVAQYQPQKLRKVVFITQTESLQALSRGEV